MCPKRLREGGGGREVVFNKVTEPKACRTSQAGAVWVALAAVRGWSFGVGAGVEEGH